MNLGCVMSNDGVSCVDYFPSLSVFHEFSDAKSAKRKRLQASGVEVRSRSNDAVEIEISLKFTSKASLADT